MSVRLRARLWMPLGMLYVALTIIATALAWRNEGELIYAIQTTLTGFTALAIVGSVLVSQRPQNPVGWLFLFASLAAGAYGVCVEVAVYGTLTVPGSISLAPLAGWLVLWFETGFVILLALSLFLVPSGTLPSDRWRPIAFGGSLWVVVITAVFTFGSVGFGPQGVSANPFFIPALAPLADALSPVGPLLFIPYLAAAVASLVARYRAGATTEKRQLKWILVGAILMVGFLVAASIPSPLGGLANFLSLAVLPTAVAIAILRYGLFDIDHLINRTLVYGGTSGVIAILFFAGIVALQPLLRPLTSGTELAVAASTLVAFALFQPIRRRVQDGVDRRFDRSRYDAARTLDAFSDELRDEVALERVQGDLLAAVSATMAPQHVSLWLRHEAPGIGSNPVTISGRPVITKELA